MNTFEAISEFVVPADLCDACDRKLREAGANGDERFVLWSGVIRDQRLLVKTMHVPRQKAPIVWQEGLCVRVDADELHRLNVWLYEHEERLSDSSAFTSDRGFSLGYRRHISDGHNARRLVFSSARLCPRTGFVVPVPPYIACQVRGGRR